MGNVFLHLKINLKKTLSLITLKRYSTLSQISLKSWTEFGGSSLKALGGDRVDNFSLRRIIIIISLNSRSVSWLSQANLTR